jgi:hypothetical protein
MKYLSCDEAVAHCILVLSDAPSAWALPDDKTRQRFVWVNDFSTEEARSYLDQRNFAPSTSSWMRQAATLPSWPARSVLIGSCCKSAPDRRLSTTWLARVHRLEQEEAFPFSWNATAARNVHQFLLKDPKAHRQLLQHLVDAGPGGSLGETLFDLEADAIARALRLTGHPVVYNFVTLSYAFSSPAHFHAANSLG